MKNNIKAYLESSTIHGLSYISATRGCTRLVWVLVVITGFSAAGVLIKQAFDSWADNPVTTTIETLPIAEAAFPRVTVCPPQQTYLDLNYHFLDIGKRTLTEMERNELLRNFAEHFQQEDFDNTLKRISQFKEKDKYRNWYRGLTAVPITYDEAKDNIEVNSLYFHTYAPSGEISSAYFRENFDVENFQLVSEHNMFIMNPYSHSSNMSIQIEYDLESEVERISRGTVYLDPNRNEYKCEGSCEVEYRYGRNIDAHFFAHWRNKRNTGFTAKWNYSQNEEDDIPKTFLSEDNAWKKPHVFNEIFVEIAYLVHKMTKSSPGDILG